MNKTDRTDDALHDAQRQDDPVVDEHIKGVWPR